ncbi:LuxR C-terminal-related transcriptional regulator [Kribbella sp. NPDC051718]|uniref:LuxR C-terminal-related transcriptional regulator n=1 Tax=Kribbella sp. NPDC051718 TaxID=3155168 RepID=UPI00341E7C11
MTTLQNDPLAPENRTHHQPHLRAVTHDPPHHDPEPRDTLTREAFAREAYAREARMRDPLARDLVARDGTGHEPLGRDVRAREAFARVGTGAHREISHDDLQLLRLLATGLPMDSVARRLDLSERTVRRRTRAACDRLGFGTAVEAIVWAARRGLL